MTGGGEVDLAQELEKFELSLLEPLITADPEREATLRSLGLR